MKTREFVVKRTAQLFPVQSSEAAGFRWKWRAVDGSKESTANFIYFFDCAEDARRAGYSVDEAIGSTTKIEQRQRRVGS